MNKSLASRTAQVFVTLSMLMLASAGAQASLIGTTATCAVTEVNNVWECDAGSATVTDPGAEFTIQQHALGTRDFFRIDIAADSLTIALALGENAAIYNQPRVFVGLSGVTGISSFSSDVSLGLDLSDFTLGNGVLEIDLHATEWQPGQSATVTFGGRVGRVPEPTTLTLAALGLLAAGCSRRRSA